VCVVLSETMLRGVVWWLACLLATRKARNLSRVVRKSELRDFVNCMRKGKLSLQRLDTEVR
jgi:hypothetical protein